MEKELEKPLENGSELQEGKKRDDNIQGHIRDIYWVDLELSRAVYTRTGLHDKSYICFESERETFYWMTQVSYEGMLLM